MKANSGILMSLLFLIVTCVPAVSYEGDLLEVVNDTRTARALKAYNKTMKKIGSECNKGGDAKGMSKARECMCKHMPEIMKANQVKIDAFLDLMKRRPELANEMVKIEGVPGNWYLDPDDPTIKNRDNLDFWEKRYHCK